MGSVFSSSTIYKVVAVLETLFSVVTLAFGIKTLFVFQSQTDSFQSHKEIILYSAIAAIIHSTIQILASVLLVAKSKSKADPGIVPRIWLLFSPFQLAVLLFIFTSPLRYCLGHLETKDNGQMFCGIGNEITPLTYEQQELLELRGSLKEMFTYVVVNIIFKFFFIWAVSSTIPYSCCRKSSIKHELIVNSNGNDVEEGDKALDKPALIAYNERG